MISVVRSKKEDGTRAKNIYILTSIKTWKRHPSDTMSHGESIGHLEPNPSDISDLNHGTPEPYNNTHNNQTNITTPRGVEKKKEEILKELFGVFWESYPLKQTKKPSLLKWMHLTPMEALAIIEDVDKRKKNDDRWIRGYIPQPLTYINQRRWEDEITKPIIKTNLSPDTPYIKGKYTNAKVTTIKNVIKPKE